MVVAVKNALGNFMVKVSLSYSANNTYWFLCKIVLQAKDSTCYLFIVLWSFFFHRKGWKKSVLAQHVYISYLPWSCLLSLSNYLGSDFGILHCIQVQVAWLFWLALWSIGGLFFCNLLGRVLRKNQRLGWGRGSSGFTGTRCMWFRGIQLGILKVDLWCSK